jgi:hypothetical protein
MFIKTVGLGAVAALAMAIAPAANATDFHVGDVPNFYLTSGTPTSPSITANFGNGFSSALSFDDSFLFTIPQNGVGSGSISTSFSSLANKLTITGLWINGTSYVVPSNASGQFLAVSGIPILNGVLNTIRVTGLTSSHGGTYSGTLTFAATTVPEAATWAMMFAGFGLIGATMRRRRTSVTFA